MTYPTGMFEFMMLATMRQTERDRATTPLVLTMLPGPAAQRGAMAAVAVTTQVQDGLRRERRVAGETVEAVKQAITDPNFTTDKLRGIPALRAVASDALRDSIISAAVVANAAAAAAVAAPPAVGAIAPVGGGVPAKVIEQAAGVAAFLVSKGTKLVAADKAKFPDFVGALTSDQRKAIFA